MSFELDSSNDFSQIGVMLNNTKELSSTQILERKFMYIEGLIRFLELYAQNEIGEVEVDIEKISLWVNSAYFENVDIYRITSIEAVYEMLTEDLIEKNIPLYRFLKLDNYKLALFEKEHHEQLIRDFDKDCTNYQCLKCIWYSVELTNFGKCSKCLLDTEAITGKYHVYRRGYHNIEDEKNRNCKYVTTIDNYDEFMDKYVLNNPHIKNFGRCNKNDLIASAEKCRKAWIEKLDNLDNSYIPVCVPDIYKMLLSEEVDVLEDLGRAFRGKLEKSEMQCNLRRAIFLEAMIKFIEIYAQTEIGSDYIASISKIAKYVNSSDLKFKSVDEIYEHLENMVYDGFDMTKFCVRKEV